MEKISYELKRNVPVVAEVDVLAVGSGPGGLCAAVTAARQGRSVAVAEHYGCPGGMAAVGEITPFMPNHSCGHPLDRPLYLEWINRMRSYLTLGLPATDLEGAKNSDRRVPKNLAMLAAEDMLLEAGVRLFYHHTAFDVVRKGDLIDAVVFHTKSGLVAIRAKMVIDSTGDGDVAVLAGCDFELGNADGYCQPMTLCFKLSGVDTARMPARSEINRLYNEAKARGEIDCLREDVLMFDDFEPDVIHFNTTRIVKHNAVDAADLSDAEILGRKQLRQYLAFLRSRVPGFEKAEIRSIATQIGVRESRRILGLEYLTVDAFERAAKFPDGIARVSYPVDIHNPSGTGTVIRHLPKDEYYEIPYGCIVPPSVRNLLVGSRCISVDHELHSSMRVMPPVCSIGQAAGMAAVMALESGCAPEKLEGSEVRKRLREIGANL